MILVDVPKESTYGQMYNLAKAVGTWDHPLLEGCYPLNPYPIEFVKQANWRTTAEKLRLLEMRFLRPVGYADTDDASVVLQSECRRASRRVLPW